MYERNAGPSRAWYGLAAVVLVVGVSFGVWLLISTVLGFFEADAAVRLVVPCEEEIELPKAGAYTIFYEHQSVLDGRVYSTGEDLPQLECALVSKEGGARIRLRGSTGASYSYGSRQGVSIFDLAIEEPGTYTFSAQFPEELEDRQVVLAFVHDFLGRLFSSIFHIFAVVGLFIGSAAAAIAIAAVTFWRRYEASKEAEAPASDGAARRPTS